MKHLRALQEKMCAVLMQPLTARDGLQKSTQADFITPNDRMSGFERLEIYARQYWFRVLDCLHDDYPALRAFLGQRRFHALCREYLARHPSSSWTLRNLGSRLPEFIRENAARDVARVEWAQTLAFDEAWLKPLAVADLARGDAATMRLGIQPCVILLRAGHAVDHFITALHKSEAEVRGAASQAITSSPKRSVTRRRPVLQSERIHLAVHRQDNRLYFKRLHPKAYRLLTALRDGRTLADALTHSKASAEQIREWFSDFSQLGWLTKTQSKDHN
jgi:hypothetical protein